MFVCQIEIEITFMRSTSLQKGGSPNESSIDTILGISVKARVISLN